MSQPLSRRSESRPTASLVLSSTLFQSIARLIEHHSGNMLSYAKKELFEHRLTQLLEDRKTPVEVFLAHCSEATVSGDVIQVLLECSLITETYFMRSPRHFERLAQEVLPRVRARRSSHKPISIWCAACSNGADAYSIAMVLHEARQRVEHSLIVATDVNEQQLEVARAGIYDQFTLRALSNRQRDRYFEQTTRGLRVHECLRENITFENHNLLHAPPLRADIIFCRNVLLYFAPSLRQSVEAHLVGALNPGGFLVLGHGERLSQETLKHGLSQVDGAVYENVG